MITIKGRSVAVVEEEGQCTIPVLDFCKLIQKQCATGFSTEPIPDQVRWIVESGDRAAYIVELPPEVRTITWSNSNPRQGISGLPRQYTVAMPYVVLAVFFHRHTILNVCVFYRKRPLKGLDDTLYFTNLKNLGSDCSLCLQKLGQISRCRSGALGELVNHLWMGEFNNEMTNAHFARIAEKEPRLCSMERWEIESRKDPSFVLGVDWSPALATPRSLIQASLHTPAHAIHLGNILLEA